MPIVMLTAFLLVVILVAAVVPVLRRRRLEARQRIIDTYTGPNPEDCQVVIYLEALITLRYTLHYITSKWRLGQKQQKCSDMRMFNQPSNCLSFHEAHRTDNSFWN